MKEWLKNNAVGLGFGILGSAGIIGAFCNDLYAVICAVPLAFWVWSAGVAVIFAALTWIIRGVVVKRKLGMTLEEAVEKLDEDKRRDREEQRAREQELEDSERQFRAMSFEAKGDCYVPAKDGLREVSGEDDLQLDYDAEDWKEAESAGFILIEHCGTHQHRIRATEKLLDLVRAKPEVLDDVEHDFAKDFTENFVIQQIIDDDGKMSPPKIVDRFTGEETDRWTIGGKKR